MSIEISKMSNLWYINTVSQNSIHAPRPGYEVLPQKHNCYEIVFYDNGCSGITTIDGIEYKFKAGDVALIHKDVIHSEKHCSKGTLYFFGFNFSGEPPESFPENGLYSNIWDVKSIISAMLHEQINQAPGYQNMLSLKIEELLLLIRRKVSSGTNTVKNLKFVKNYIQENYMQDVSIENLAKMSGYSVAHFRKLFTDEFGVSPKNYLMDIRCKNAVDLLQNSELNCTDIAYLCGFSNSTQLSKILKAKYGCSPLKIRKNV